MKKSAKSKMEIQRVMSVGQKFIKVDVTKSYNTGGGNGKPFVPY